MIDARQSFLGGLDLDTSLYALRKDCYIDALNITRDSVTSNQDIGVTNVIGNRKVDYTLPLGTCKVIGAKEDQLRNRIIYFVYNSNDNHSILNYNNTTRTISKVLESKTDSGGIDILQFDINKKILHIEIVHRDEGDILYWTDGNVSIKGGLIDKLSAGTYGTVELEFIEAAKNQPSTVPVCGYGDDTTKNNNSLRKKLFKFKSRSVFDDLSRSTWSSISTVPLPAGLTGTDADLDATKNNFIAVTVETGNKNVIAIEIATQNSEGNLWSDFYQIAYLNKSEQAIADNGVFTYNFYNDGVYPPIDLRESNLLFDWWPLLAKSMVLANGNVIVPGAITEGYDKMSIADIDVEMTVTNIKNTGIETGGPSLTYIQQTAPPQFNFTVSGSVPVGTHYKVSALIGPIPPAPTFITLAEYTSIIGDDINDVAHQLFLSMPAPYQLSESLNTFQAQLPANSSIVNIEVTPGSGTTTIATESTWNWNDKILFGLVYFDKKGRTNGVVHFVSQSGGDTDFEINTPNFSQNGGTPETPVISASINHVPYTWADSYMWVRTKSLSFERFLYDITNDFQSDADYYYFGVENIRYFFNRNNKFNYSQVSVTDGDRIKVLGTGAAGVYGSDIYNLDFEVLGIVRRQVTGGLITDLGDFVKVKKPVAAPSPVFISTMFVMIYTPAKVANTPELNVFYEFDKRYAIYEDSGNRYHRGMNQDQTAIQPATFEFSNGNIYYHQRRIYVSTVTGNSFTWVIPDANYNDFFLSEVNGDGRPEVIDVNAKETYYPATLRFGQEFQPNTNINNLNRFYPENFRDYNREYGSILKMRVRDQYIKVGQQFKLGAIPVELQIIKTSTGDSQVTISDTLLNPIHYYEGEFGIGDSPESWASFNFSDYGVDNNRGIVWRLDRSGTTPISIVYKINSWATNIMTLRTGNYKIYGGYDTRSNNFILALEATGSDAAQAISFDEESKAFESFLSYSPDIMVTLGKLLVTFKDGELWTHDSTVYNTFYGVTYDSYITPVILGATPLQKKKWISLAEVSNTKWDCPLIYTNVNSYGTQRQESNLIEDDLALIDGNYNASFWMDSNSRGGLIDGDTLNGNFLVLKLRKQTPTTLVSLSLISVKYIDNELNNK